MLERYITPTLLEYLATTPAVVLLGPRQVGKTTLAYGLSKIAASKGVALPSIYLDLESTEDLALLNNAEQYLRSMQDKLIILDEVQRTPRLFEPLRGLIDHARRNGKPAGLYLLLGSASLDLVQKSSESLAGRVVFLELSGLHRLEVPSAQWGDLWLRGGYPPSLTAPSLAASIRWRRNFIRTYLERDIPQFAPRIAAERLRRFWTMLAHLQSSTVNVAQLARNLDVSVATAGNYLDLLVDLLMVRKLPPWHNNTGKRLIKTPKIYLRDSGLLHSLLDISNMSALLSHPAMGASWEGHVVESLLSVAPPDVTASFYRSAGGAEIDLVLTLPNGEHWAIEIKHSTAPKLGRGFYSACEDIRPTQKWLVYSGTKAYALGEDNDIQVLPLEIAMQKLAIACS